MYAVFATGGKQYRAITGDILKIEKLDAEKGATVKLDQVLMVGEGEDVKVGTPYLKGGTVTATVVEHGRGDKIRIIKFKRRKHHMKKMGHRQDFTRIEITGIAASVPKKKVSEAKAEKPVSKAKAEKPVSKAKAEKPVSKAKAEKPVSKAKAEKPKAVTPEVEATSEAKK
jgi:large subunit ribosomal protein L21